MGRLDFDYLAYEKSPIGMIGLRRRSIPGGEVVTEVTVDHALLMSSGNTASERALASGALERHAGRGLRVLVGGLGLGYTAHEALCSERVAAVEVVEYLPQVVDWLDRGLLPLADELRRDARLAVVVGDVYARLAKPPERTWDLVLIDVDHAPEENLVAGNEAFYTEPGLVRAREHVAPGGLLGVWSYAESPAFEATLRRVFSEVAVVPESFRNRIVDEDETNWLYFGRA